MVARRKAVGNKFRSFYGLDAQAQIPQPVRAGQRWAFAQAGRAGLEYIIYGFIKETPKSKDQQTQAAQEAARSSPQEAHLAEVVPIVRNAGAVAVTGALKDPHLWGISVISPEGLSILVCSPVFPGSTGRL